MVVATVVETLAAWGAYDQDDPFPVFAGVRELGTVHPVTMADGYSAWLVSGYQEARAALKDSRLSKDMHAAMAADGDVVSEGLPGPAFARHMLSVNPPDHTRLRRLVAAAFSPRRIDGLRPRVQAIVDDLLDHIAAQGPSSRVDLIAAFAFPLPFTVICELLGVPGPVRARWAGFAGMLVPISTAPDYARAKKASDAVVAILAELVEAKQAAPADDLVSDLISARDGDERLSTQELLSTIFQLIVAGHDTTTSLIGNSVVALLRNPAQLAQLRSDPGKIGAAIEELLRYDAPVRIRHSATRPNQWRSAIRSSRPGLRSSSRWPPRTGTLTGTPTRRCSTSTGLMRVTSRSGTAYTTVSALRWHARKASWPSGRCCTASPNSASPSPPPSCTGATATGSCCAACPSCPSFPGPRRIST